MFRFLKNQLFPVLSNSKTRLKAFKANDVLLLPHDTPPWLSPKYHAIMPIQSNPKIRLWRSNRRLCMVIVFLLGVIFASGCGSTSPISTPNPPHAIIILAKQSLYDNQKHYEKRWGVVCEIKDLRVHKADKKALTPADVANGVTDDWRIVFAYLGRQRRIGEAKEGDWEDHTFLQGVRLRRNGQWSVTYEDGTTFNRYGD